MGAIDDELEQPLRPLDVLQFVLAEIHQPRSLKAEILDDARSRTREESLATMPAAQIRAARCTGTPT
jgi:hypothetical protein